MTPHAPYRVPAALLLFLALAVPAQAQITRTSATEQSPAASATYALLLPGLAYATWPLTGGACAIVAPALASGGHLAAGSPARGLSIGLAGGILGLAGFAVGQAYLPAGGAAQAATAVGIPFILWAAADAAREAAGRQPIDVPEEPPPGPLTTAHYQALRDGMSVETVKAVIGRPGRRVDNSRANGVPAETWRWTNPDGSYLEASFQGDRLVGKAQRRLPAPDPVI